MPKKIAIILLALFITSCAGYDNTKKLYANIRKEMKQLHGIADGEIVAKFDLGGIEKNNDQKLFANYYANAIGTSHGNNKFLREFAAKYRHKDFLEEIARKKHKNLSSLLLIIDEKYKALSPSIAKKLQIYKKNKNPYHQKNGNFLARLTNLHNKTKTMPIFSPIACPRVTSNFGARFHPHSKKKTHHSGLDLCGIPSCPIFSAGDGTIEEISRGKGYGNNIIIRHTEKISSRYAHLSKILVKQGDRVLLGQKIGLQGCSGTSTGQHLHFEVIVNNKPVNPKDFIGGEV
ncbi:MAG: M23 family metallopeptidase [Rickettsiaceae bacterium]|nr:M23 family metallopeptidase [Rickettsiaceae bacterium]